MDSFGGLTGEQDVLLTGNIVLEKRVLIIVYIVINKSD